MHGVSHSETQIAKWHLDVVPWQAKTKVKPRKMRRRNLIPRRYARNTRWSGNCRRAATMLTLRAMIRHNCEHITLWCSGCRAGSMYGWMQWKQKQNWRGTWRIRLRHSWFYSDFSTMKTARHVAYLRGVFDSSTVQEADTKVSHSHTETCNIPDTGPT